MSYQAPYIDEAGLHIASYNDIRDSLLENMKQIFGQDIYLENDSQDYQMISAFALMLYDIQRHYYWPITTIRLLPLSGKG